jgi:hypothetical protein
MLRGGHAAGSGARALQTCMEMTLPQEAEVELKQVMKSLGSGGKEEIDNQSYMTGVSIDDQGRMVMRIPAHLHHVLLGPRVKAYMARPAARPEVERTSVEDDKSNICTDCGAAMTITGSMANTTDVQVKCTSTDVRVKCTWMCSHQLTQRYQVRVLSPSPHPENGPPTFYPETGHAPRLVRANPVPCPAEPVPYRDGTGRVRDGMGASGPDLFGF